MVERIISPHAPCVCASPRSACVRFRVSFVIVVPVVTSDRICSASRSRSFELSTWAV